jgi:hypothetical protein
MLERSMLTSPALDAEAFADLYELHASAVLNYCLFIPTLAWLPPGFKLGGAHVMPPDWANVFYAPADPELVAAQAGLGVAIRRGSDTTTRSHSGARVQEDILVHGRATSYIAGPAFGLLTWEAGGFSYDLSYSGVELSREDVQRLAESLR